jgi:hypothetical protein
MADILEPTNEVREAIDTLVAEGKAERIVIDGELHIRLTQAGMDAAAEVVRRVTER